MTDRPVRIALSEAAFRRLVAGKVVTIIGRHVGSDINVEIILSDIGFEAMGFAVLDGQRERTQPDKQA